MEDSVTPLAHPSQPDPYSHWATGMPSARRASEALSETGSRSLGELSLHGHHRKDSLISDDGRRSSASSGYSSPYTTGSSAEFSGWGGGGQPSYSNPAMSQPLSNLEAPHSAPILPVTNTAPIQAKPAPMHFPQFGYGSHAPPPPLQSSIPPFPSHSQAPRPLSVNTSRPSTAASHHASPSASITQSPRTASSANLSGSTTGTTPPDSARGSIESDPGRRVFADSAIDDSMRSADLGPMSAVSSSSSKKDSPYARSPEMRVSHKMAERKRRKEMRDLFDELRDSMPVERGMKASKWETLTAAIEHIRNLEAAAAMDRHRIMELESMVRRLTPGVGSFAPQQPPLTTRGPPMASQMPLPGPSTLGDAPPTPTSHHFPQSMAAPPSTGSAGPPELQQQPQQHQQYWSMPPQHPHHVSNAHAALTALPPVSTQEVYRERM